MPPSIAVFDRVLELSRRLEGKGRRERRPLWPAGPRQVYEVDGRIGRHDDFVLRPGLGSDRPRLAEQRVAGAELRSEFSRQPVGPSRVSAEIIEVLAEPILVDPGHPTTLRSAVPSR